MAQQASYSSSSSCPSTIGGSSQTQYQQYYYSYPQQNCPIGSAVGASTVRATRAFTETLSDRNEQGATANAPAAGMPAGVSQYAPAPTAFQAQYPIKVSTTPPPMPYRVFATGFGGGFSDNAVASQTGSYYGGLIGVDYRVNPILLVGVAAGGSSSNTTISSLSSGNVSGFNGSLFGIVNMGPFYGQTLTTLSSFSNATTRNVAATAGTPFSVEKSSFGSFEVRERMEVGRVFALGTVNGIPNFKVTPFIAMEIAQLHLNGHNEFNANGVGNAAGQGIPGTDVADVPGFIGIRLDASYDLGNGMVLSPVLRLAYVHQFATETPAASTLLAGGPVAFAQNGTLLGRDSAQTKAGFELNMGRGTTVFANFDGLFSANDQLYGGRAGIRYSF